LYNHPTLTQDGVLVLGPSRAFLRYISAVLPSLGEEAVVQSTVADLAPRITLRSVDPPDVRRLKGDPRMSLLLAAALQGRRRTVEEDVTLRARFDRELPASEEFHTLLDHVWPSVSPTALVSEVLTSADRLAVAAEGIFTEPEWRSLLRTKGKRVGTQAWTVDDLPLLDEAEYLINGRTRTYGHVVVDEAQDLSPMQFRMVARRSPSGSLTILGDLAQATGPWNYATWDEILRHLPETSVSRHDELTLGYRAPGQILDLASKLLPEAAPRVQPTRSIRQGRREPRITQVDRDDLFAHSVREATTLADEGLLVGVVVSAGDLAGMTAFVGERGDIGLLDRDGMHRQVTVVEATAAKGLEFDAVVVVEPAAIAGVDARGLRLLYVAMTRPIQHLSMVHSQPLPELLLASRRP
jgi:DNA helicase IV